MEFYLIRHGIAEDREIDDLERRLTKEGIRKTKDVSNFLAKIFPKPDFILTSEALRSIETAEIFAKKWKTKKIDSYSKLNPGSSVYDYIFIISAYLNKDIVRSNYRIALITHEPDLSNFAIGLLSNQIQFDFQTEEIFYKEEKIPINIKLKKTSFIIIPWNGVEGNLKFYATPSIIKSIKKKLKK